MPTNFVNLDALIPREDFAVKDGKVTSVSAVEKLDIHHLEQSFFLSCLRKPDFQRETAQWSPSKVVDLIAAFIDRQLIPAVILWQAGSYVFVIDGAHRLSALIAWVYDDYGDAARSLEFFDNRITEEQRKAALKTRNAVKTLIGTYAEFKAARDNPKNIAPEIQAKASNLATTFITAQWIPTKDSTAAEDSYFKINQAATPIDPTERRILQSRKSPNAIAARAITRAGTGHRYWSNFDESRQNKIEELGRHIYSALYEPPMGEGAIKTLDVPVAGRGYNVLPFVFDLVNQTNNVKIADSTKSKQVTADTLEKDTDGSQTLEFLGNVKRHIDRVIGKSSASLGPHPLVYFYTRSGAFQPSAFLAFDLFVDFLKNEEKLKQFTEARKEFEDFLIRNKEHVGHIVHRFGSGNRNVPAFVDYFKAILMHIGEGKNGMQIEEALKADNNYAFLFSPRPTTYRASDKPSGKAFGKSTRSAAFINQALEGVPKCQICHGAIHRNSMQVDHIQKKEHGGTADMKNAQISHPYCNSQKG